MPEWYYSDGATQFGPLDLDAMRALRASGKIRADTLVWRKGFAEWVRADSVAELRHAAKAEDVVSRMSAQVNSITGTDRVNASHVSGLFSQVFRSHTEDEAEEVFATGLKISMARQGASDFGSPTPWVFSRILVFFGIAFVVLWYCWTGFKALTVLPGVILVGSFAFPLAAGVFFFECNAAKNISLFIFARLFMWGGVLSILLALALFRLTEGLEQSMGASVAAIAEEPAKLATVVLLTRSLGYRWTVNGMCLGAAVGAGFAAFESAGYALLVLIGSGGSTEAMLDNIIDRGVLAPFSHVVWTAIAAGGLWRVKGDRPFEWGMLWEKHCIAPLLAAMICHGVWNSSLPDKLPSYSGYVLLGLVAWVIAIGLLLGGLRELRESRV